MTDGRTRTNYDTRDGLRAGTLAAGHTTTVAAITTVAVVRARGFRYENNNRIVTVTDSPSTESPARSVSCSGGAARRHHRPAYNKIFVIIRVL